MPEMKVHKKQGIDRWAAWDNHGKALYRTIHFAKCSADRVSLRPLLLSSHWSRVTYLRCLKMRRKR